jgi:hypothetical protein
MKPRFSVPESERRPLVIFVTGFTLLVLVWACLHDMALMRMEPRHFTEFHRTLLPLASPVWLAVQYAVVATLGPGMVFGALAWAMCRLGNRHPKLQPGVPFLLFVPLLLLMELAARVIGRMALLRHKAGLPSFFPEYWYPEQTSGIVYTQTVNITTYLAAVAGGMVFLAGLRLLRVPVVFAAVRGRFGAKKTAS